MSIWRGCDILSVKRSISPKDQGKAKEDKVDLRDELDRLKQAQEEEQRKIQEAAEKRKTEQDALLSDMRARVALRGPLVVRLQNEAIDVLWQGNEWDVETSDCPLRVDRETYRIGDYEEGSRYTLRWSPGDHEWAEKNPYYLWEIAALKWRVEKKVILRWRFPWLYSRLRTREEHIAVIMDLAADTFDIRRSHTEDLHWCTRKEERRLTALYTARTEWRASYNYRPKQPFSEENLRQELAKEVSSILEWREQECQM